MTFKNVFKKTLSAISIISLSVSAFADNIVVAYQTGVDPSKVPQASGTYDKVIGQKLDWRRFNSGAEVITALASGSVQIANLGSSPLAAAASRKLPIEAFIVSAQIGASEALVVRNGSGITSAHQLIGKKIATPFVSTSHYSLLGALNHWNIKANQVKLINLNPAEINAAWKRGDLDAAFVWSPALAEIKKTGKVLTDASQVGTWGAPTFEVWVVRKDFASKHPEIVSKFAQVTLNSFAEYNKNKTAWSASAPAVLSISKITGVAPADVLHLLAGAKYPSIAEQLSPALLGGGTAKDIVKTALFLKTQGMVGSVLTDYSPYVNAKYIQAIAK